MPIGANVWAVYADARMLEQLPKNVIIHHAIPPSPFSSKHWKSRDFETIGVNGVTLDFDYPQVTEKMERETGVEPAASSLGIDGQLETENIAFPGISFWRYRLACFRPAPPRGSNWSTNGAHEFICS